METYFFEMTDTFAGEANYCWVRRVLVRATSLRGACIKAARHFGVSGRIRKAYDAGDLARWDVRNAAICVFASPAECGEGYDLETI